MPTIYDFHTYIDEKILVRGRELFQQEAVSSLENSNTVWTAIVSGGNDYTIRIAIEDDKLINAVCSCPYNMGYCKHLVAVFCAIRKKLQDQPGQRRKIQSRPISIKERHSILFLEKGQIDVIDGSFVIIDKNGIRTHVPIGGITTLMLEPGIRISHAAVALAAEVGCLLVWVGDGGVRLYSAGQPGGARTDKLLYQARLALEDNLRLKVVRAMYEFRFKEKPPAKRSVEQLRGIEGARVRSMYQLLAHQYKVPWKRRNYDPKNWDSSDVINRCLSTATHCLYGICESAILAAGYAPAIGFIHTGKPRSFVYDIADLFKFETVVPVAFKVVKEALKEPVKMTRLRCRSSFREHRILKRIIPTIEEILSAGGIDYPGKPQDTVPIVIFDEEGIGDAGHRN